MRPSHIPAGQCRVCGYAMDPGRCPECGNICLDVTPRPGWRELWRPIGAAALWVLVPAVLAVVIVVGVRIYAALDPGADLDSGRSVVVQTAWSCWMVVSFASVLLGLGPATLRIQTPDRTWWQTAAMFLAIPVLGVLSLLVGVLVLGAQFP